jgi:folate-binding Fe-S cluster repair protein YgfZ
MRLGDAIVLELPRERVADTLKRLRLFVMRAKVTLEDESDGPIRIGVAGRGAVGALAALGLALPDLDNDLAVTGEVTVLRLSAPVPRFELIADYATQSALWDALTPVSTWGDEDAWALLDIRAGKGIQMAGAHSV